MPNNFSQIISLEDCMEEGQNKENTIRSLVSWAVKEYASNDKFKSDTRMLDLWKLMVSFLVITLFNSAFFTKGQIQRKYGNGWRPRESASAWLLQRQQGILFSLG